MDFNFPVGSMQSRRATAVPPDFSGCSHSINTLQCWHSKRTDMSTSEALLPLILRLAVQFNRPWSSVPSSLYPFKFELISYWEELGEILNVNHIEKACYYNDGNAGGSDFSNDTFVDRCTLTLTTSRTATIPTATRKTSESVTSTRAKECTKHRVYIKKHPLQLLDWG